MPGAENPHPYGSQWDKPSDVQAHNPATNNYPDNPSSNKKQYGEPDMTVFDKEEELPFEERTLPGGYLVKEDIRHNRYSSLKFLASQEGRARLQIDIPTVVDQAYSRMIRAFREYKWMTIEKCNGSSVVVKGILDSFSGEWFGDLKFNLDVSIPATDVSRYVEVTVPVEVRRREATWKGEDKFEAKLADSLGRRYDFSLEGLKMLMDYDPDKYKTTKRTYLNG